MRKLLSLALLASAAFGVTLPRQAGDVAIQTPFGIQRLSNFKGKCIVLGFILTTCPHCQATTQVLSRIQNDYKAKGVQVLEGAFNAEAPQKIGEFIGQYKPTFPVGVVDPNFVANYAQITPDMRPTVPILFFIDRTGQIRAQFFGSDKIFEGDQNKNIRAEIDKLLGFSVAPVKKAEAHKK